MISSKLHNCLTAPAVTDVLTNICSLFSLQCEPGLGASVMYDLLYNKPQKLMLLAGCSTVCTTVAEAAKMWNLVVVSCVFRPVTASNLSSINQSRPIACCC